MFLVMHGGYDFDPTTLAICSSREKADAMIAEHYAAKEDHADYPWNGCFVVEADLDAWVPYPKDSVRSLGATLEDDAQAAG